MLSLIVPITNEEIYQSMLVNSLNKQSFHDFEIIKIDAKEHPFNNAAEALNYGVSLAKGDIYIFCHQDIELIDEDGLEKIVAFSKEHDFGVLSVAGVKIGNKEVFASVTQGKNHSPAGSSLNEVMSIDVVDECLFVIKKENFEPFKNYGSWHFYAVERCLYYKYKKSMNNYLIPIEIYHLSPGWSLDNSYWNTLIKVAKDYKEAPYITTTICNIKNNGSLKIKVFFKRIKSFIKRRLKWRNS